MKNVEKKLRFNASIAKAIATNQFGQTIDCIIGNSDPDYSLSDEIHVYEQNFEEDLQEMGINPTPVKIEQINIQYERLVKKAVEALEKIYAKNKAKVKRE